MNVCCGSADPSLGRTSSSALHINRCFPPFLFFCPEQVILEVKSVLNSTATALAFAQIQLTLRFRGRCLKSQLDFLC